MNKVAIFGNTGAGKSTLAIKLADITGLPLHSIDKLQFLPGGEPIPHSTYLANHDEILQAEQWLIDGFGCMESVWKRLAAADTLVYIDLPVWRHYWWVTKRFLSGLFVTPAGWPANSPIFSSTLRSYKTVALCDEKLTPRYRDYVAKVAGEKTVYHLRTVREVKQFVANLEPIS